MAIDHTRKWLKGRAKKLLALRRRLILLTHHKCATTFVQNYLERVCAINSLPLLSGLLSLHQLEVSEA